MKQSNSIALDTVQSERPAIGRPRLLTRDTILNAAVELGLEDLTMKRLAAHLGSGAATLYQYFENRDALMRAAALHAVQDMRLPIDKGQHWSEFSRSFAKSIQNILVENPTAVRHYQEAEYKFDVQFEMVEYFLSVLKKQGFTIEDAMKLLRAATMVGIYCAIEMIREAAFVAKGENLDQVLEQQLSAIGKSDLPLVHDASAYLVIPAKNLLDEVFNPILRDWAQQRGEVLPLSK